MEKATPVITVTAVFMFLFSYGNITGNISAQTTTKSVQSQTKSTQTESKSVQTKPKSTTPVTKPAQSVQTKPKSTTPVTKPAQSVQTKPKSTTPVTKPAQSVQTKPKSTTPVTKPAQSVQTKPKSTTPVTKSTQPVKTKPKPATPVTKPVQAKSKSEPVNTAKDEGTVRIGTQIWAATNLNVSTFRNGDSIPEAKTNKEWVAAGESGKPAWCYYNNDPKYGPKFGKLYNWFAVNDSRGLAPAGWTLPGDADWAELMYNLGGPEVSGEKMKSTSGWIEGNFGNNESGFTGLSGGYRIENGLFLKLGSIGTWWSTTENKYINGIDYYLSLNRSFGRGSSPKQRGESIRCLRK